MAYIHAATPAIRMTTAAQLRAMGTPEASAELTRRKANREAKKVARTPVAATPMPEAFAFLTATTPAAAPVVAPVKAAGRGKNGRVTLTQRVESLEGGLARIEALLVKALG